MFTRRSIRLSSCLSNGIFWQKCSVFTHLSYPVIHVAKTAGSGRIPKRRRGRAKLPPVKVFGHLLAEGRQKKGLSLGQVAMRANARGASTSKPEIGVLEKGERPKPDALLVRILAEMYGLSFAWLMEVLRWNRVTPQARAEDLPDSLPVEEGIVIVQGLEKDFITRFRHLSARQQEDVLRFVRWTEEGRGVTSPSKATFRRKDTPA